MRSRRLVGAFRGGIATSALAACGGSTAMPPELPAWDKTLPPADVMGVRRGLTPARGIVHLHSPYSHDACDGAPRDAGGAPNEPCLADLRLALCTDRIDFAAVTDHDDTMADEAFETLFSMRAGDEAVMRGTDQIASRITCEDGHQVLLTVGGENDLMPLMLHHHVPGTAAERHAIYNANDAAATQAFRDAGGLAWVAHTESKTLETLRAVRPDGIEVYNLHANLDPKIRPLLGLDPSGAITAAAEFADTNPGHPEPDLAILSFLTPNAPALATWQTLLGEGVHLAVTAGSDAHENAIPIALADGERGDSYRRVLRWFSNVVLVADPHDPDQIEAALAGGRVYAVFEVMGTPEGFDVVATTPGGTTAELGETIPRGSTLTVTVPTVRGLDPTLPVPEIHGTLTRIAPGAAPEVIGSATRTFTTPLPGPGAYRVEITIVPHHLGPYLGDLGTEAADRALPWIYTSPIYVQ